MYFDLYSKTHLPSSVAWIYAAPTFESPPNICCRRRFDSYSQLNYHAHCSEAAQIRITYSENASFDLCFQCFSYIFDEDGEVLLSLILAMSEFVAVHFDFDPPTLEVFRKEKFYCDHSGCGRLGVARFMNRSVHSYCPLHAYMHWGHHEVYETLRKMEPWKAFFDTLNKRGVFPLHSSPPPSVPFPVRDYLCDDPDQEMERLQKEILEILLSDSDTYRWLYPDGKARVFSSLDSSKGN